MPREVGVGLGQEVGGHMDLWVPLPWGLWKRQGGQTASSGEYPLLLLLLSPVLAQGILLIQGGTGSVLHFVACTLLLEGEQRAGKKGEQRCSP